MKEILCLCDCHQEDIITEQCNCCELSTEKYLMKRMSGCYYVDYELLQYYQMKLMNNTKTITFEMVKGKK